MAKIQIKRGNQADVESLTLAEGELAVALDTGNVYIGLPATSGGGSPVKKLINPTGGTAETADKLATKRNFSLSGDATAPAVQFDGSADVALEVTLANVSGLTAGTYTKLTVDGKGRVTSGASLTASDLPDIDGGTF